MLAGLNLLVFVFALLVAAILSGGLQSGPMMLGFHAAPESIPLLRAGAQVRIPVMIHQRSGGDALAIKLSGTIVSDRGERELVDTRVGHLAPRATRLVYLPWVPPNRGVHTWSRLQAESGFPFGLLGKRVRWKVDRELVVRPRHLKSCVLWDLEVSVRLLVDKPVTMVNLLVFGAGGWAIVEATSPLAQH